MRLNKMLGAPAVAILLTFGVASQSPSLRTSAQSADTPRSQLINEANERRRVSLASGAGLGAPASEPVGESEGQRPSDKK